LVLSDISAAYYSGGRALERHTANL
jgi:hypothetical protein